jgi:hypothetical protein
MAEALARATTGGQWIESNIWYPYDRLSRFLGRRVPAGDAPDIGKGARHPEKPG